MSIEKMRQFLIGTYKGKAWAEKVKNMSDSQVIAVYKNIMNRG